jgi:hypothetical protein
LRSTGLTSAPRRAIFPENASAGRGDNRTSVWAPRIVSVTTSLIQCRENDFLKPEASLEKLLLLGLEVNMMPTHLLFASAADSRMRENTAHIVGRNRLFSV